MDKRLQKILSATGSISWGIFEILLKTGVVAADVFVDGFTYHYMNRGTKQSIRNALRRLKSKGYLEASKQNGRVIYKLPEEVRAELQAFEKLKLKLSGGQQWDKRWRLVLFDVPEAQKNHRDTLRWRLKSLGMEKFQHSIWVTPYPLIEEFYEIIDEAGLEDCVHIIETDKMPNQEKWLKLFSLTPNSHAPRPRIK